MTYRKAEQGAPRKRIRRALGTGLLAATALAPITAGANAQSMPLWWNWSEITGLSADGSRYVGRAFIEAVSEERGILGRDADGTTVVLEPYVGRTSYVTAINRSGTAVAGHAPNADGFSQAFRWTEQGGYEYLGVLLPSSATARSHANGISGDGRRVVGASYAQGSTRPFVWIEGSTEGVLDNEQMYALPRLTGGTNGEAYGISDDGRFAVGYSEGDATTGVAVRWTLDGLGSGGVANVQPLGSLESSVGGNSRAYGVSADGRVVVGYSTDAVGMGSHRAFRWVEGSTTGVADNVQMHDLGTLGGRDSNANAVSRDGNTVVGEARDASEEWHAFRWTEATGMESVEAWLVRHGVQVGPDRYERATAVSDDGNVVAGAMVVHDGSNNGQRAFIARVGGAGSGVMDVAQYNSTLLSTTSVAQAGEYLTWLPMNGAHHRPLMAGASLAGGACAWATGDLGYHSASGTGVALAEVGACADLFDGAVRAGVGVGKSHSWQALALGGSADLGGQYAIGEIDWKPADVPLLLSVTGMVGGWSADIARAYTNGAATDVSRGRTAVDSTALRLRAEWVDAARFGRTSLNPWASIGTGRVVRHGYVETGGAFPARFDAQTLYTTEARLGLTAVTQISAATTLSTTIEVAQRWGTNPTATGNVIGLFGFGMGGGDSSNFWARAGVDVDHKLTNSLAVSGSLHAATGGRDATVSGSLGLRASF